MENGIALISNKMKHRDRVYVGGIEKYEGKLLTVMEKSSCTGDCLCLSDDQSGLGDIHKDDVICFLPLTKKQGIIIPTGLSFTDEINWIGYANIIGVDKFNIKYVMLCSTKQEVIKDLNLIK